MIDIGPNLTHVLFGIGALLKFLISAVAVVALAVVALIWWNS